MLASTLQGVINEIRNFSVKSFGYNPNVQPIFHPYGKNEKGTGQHFSELFEKRQRGDYGDLFDFDEETIVRLYGPSVEFINTVEALLNQTSPDNSGATVT